MNQVYLKFYNEKVRQLHIDMIGKLDLDQYPYLTFDGDTYHLKPNILIGTIDHKGSFGFLRQIPNDLYIEGKDLKDTMQNDIVLVKDGIEPKVIMVLERNLKTIIATVRKKQGQLYYDIDQLFDREVLVNNQQLLVAGHVVKLIVDEIAKDYIQTHVSKIIGHENDVDIETLKIVATFDWPTTFKEETLEYIKHIDIDMTKETKERLDLRNLLTITIDGKDAKDLDDAISLEKKGLELHVGVHIADVSYYVKEHSLLDEEAKQRGTSVYLADRVIPMLPHILSNDWCSLNAHEPKLALSCLMVLDLEGKVISYEIKKTIIESNYRLTYDQVNQFLHHELAFEDKALEQMLLMMNELSKRLQKTRRARGEIEFESLEIGFKVDEEGRVIDVFERKTDEAEALIESFMLLANETVAFHLHHAEIPALYRVHEQPDQVKIKEALEKISRLGLKVNLKQIGPKLLQRITKESSEKPYQTVIHMLLLRAMQKAKYSEKSLGHFGLGARYYTHFTSPIRRYPDLMIHRVIHQLVLGESTDYLKTYHEYQQLMPSLGTITSELERTAIEMERDVNQLKSCEYMQNKIGQVFEAQVITMLKSGMFVRTSQGIEGFIALRTFRSFLTYDELTLSYVAHGIRIKLGQKMKVKLKSVDMINRMIDFEMVDKKKK